MEQDDTELDMKKRFKELEDKVNKIQEQLAEADKSNEENAQTLKQLKRG
jgi:23S rRNA C2498 (ribose-2'-O)-methylase RlmM